MPPAPRDRRRVRSAAPRRRDGVIDLAALCASASNVTLLDLGWPELVLPYLVTLVILGPPGSGKSTLVQRQLEFPTDDN